MPRELLIEVGNALFGDRWQSDLARALGVAIRTVQRWDAGDTEPPRGVFDDLLKLVEQRSRELAQIAEELKKQIL